MEPSLSLPSYAYEPTEVYTDQNSVNILDRNNILVDVDRNAIADIDRNNYIIVERTNERHSHIIVDRNAWGDHDRYLNTGDMDRNTVPVMERNSLSVGVRSDQIRRLSPIPPGGHQFPTVPELEEPTTPSSEDTENMASTENMNYSVITNSPKTSEREGVGHRKQRRRLPYISSTTLTKNRSSRSFDSGISNLLSDSGSPSPPLPGEKEQEVHPCNQGEAIISHRSGYSTSYLSSQSPTSSPVPARSPVTPSKRASFHAYNRSSPAQLPKTPVPPNSPSYKHTKPGFFSARRFSEQNSIGMETGSNFSTSRTLSPISVSPSSNINKSPSPSYSSSSKSSPQLRGSPVLRPSYSLHSNESSGSPPKSPDMCSPLSPTSSPPISRISRRMLPETPMKQSASKELPTSRIGTNSRIVMGPVRDSNPNSDFAEKRIAWQPVTSHDSLDSGVYSRSNTSDSVRETLSCYSRANTSSPILNTNSPTLARHHSWRKSYGAKLPEPPSSSTLEFDTVFQNRRQSLPGGQQNERLSNDVEGLNLTPKRTYDNLSKSNGISSHDARCADTRFSSQCDTTPKYIIHDRAGNHPASNDRNDIDCAEIALEIENHGLEVPKLRELKSHSFPPPWNCEAQEGEVNQAVNPGAAQHPCLAHPHQGHDSADEKRKRWIFCKNYMSGSR